MVRAGLVGVGTETRVAVRGLRAQGVGNLVAIDGARLELSDALLDAPVGGGVAVIGVGTTLDVSGLWIRDGVPVFLGPRFAGVATLADAVASLTDVTVERTSGGTSLLASLSQVHVERVVVVDSAPGGTAEGLRLERAVVSGGDVLVRGIGGAGLVLIENDAELARVAVLDNDVGILRQGDNRLVLDPGRVAGNEKQDEVCDQCSEAPPVVAPPTPLPPL